MVGSNAIGVAAGLLAYFLFAAGGDDDDAGRTLSVPRLRLAVSSGVAIFLTVAGMLFSASAIRQRVQRPSSSRSNFCRRSSRVCRSSAAVLVLVAVQRLLPSADRVTAGIAAVTSTYFGR